MRGSVDGVMQRVLFSHTGPVIVVLHPDLFEIFTCHVKEICFSSSFGAFSVSWCAAEGFCALFDLPKLKKTIKYNVSCSQ